MYCENRALDPAWHHWLGEHPGFGVIGPEEQGDRGNRYLPVECRLERHGDCFCKQAVLQRRADEQITVLWRG